MRILGLDYGSRRIGVAICDELGITARGLCAIERKTLDRDIAEIGKLVEDFAVEKIVTGYPVTLGGKEGTQCEKVRAFAGILESRLSVPVVFWDESLSTKDAEEILIEADMSRKKRKKVVDRLAAAIILQGYLDHMKRNENVF